MCIGAYRPVCRQPCCRAATEPVKQGKWWKETDSAAVDGSAAHECTPTPKNKKKHRGRGVRKDRGSIWMVFKN